MRNGANNGYWFYDLDAFDLGVAAMMRVLETYRPTPEGRAAMAVVEQNKPQAHRHG